MRIVHNIISVADQVWIHDIDPPYYLAPQENTDVHVSFEAEILGLEASTIAIATVNFSEEPCVGVNFSNLLTYTLHLAHNVKSKN